MNNIIKIRIILWLGLAAVVGWLLYMGIVPSGQIAYVKDFTKDNYFIRKLTPEERVGDMIDGSQKIMGDPVYFTLRTPRRFDKAKLSIKYRKQEAELPIGSSASLIEVGVLADKTIWRYDLQPIENEIIDQLALVWDVIRQDGLILLQKEKKFNSIDEFLNNLPNRKEMALYNYDLKEEFLLPDYEASEEVYTISNPLRGNYQFYTYIKDEILDFKFIIADINQNTDSDPVNLILYYDEEVIDSRSLPDDGIWADSGEQREARELKFNLSNLPEGVYKLELRANDDIITKQIITKQKKLAFNNKLWLAGTDREDIVLHTDSNRVDVQTVNPAKLQTIKTGDKELAISQTYKQFSQNLDGTSTEVILAKDDIIIAGDEVFSFSQEAMINPQFKKIIPNLDITKEGISYILAGYSIPESEENWKIAQAEFDLAQAYREFYKYNFLISVPGLKVDDDKDDSIEIKEIKVELEGTTLWEKARRAFNK